MDPLWGGMPEYDHEDLRSTSRVIVHFATEEDRQAFARLVGQQLTAKTKSIWYPEAEVGRFANKRYVSEDK